MSKLLVVFGATGQQGGSVVDYVINDPILSKEFKVRAITRDTSKPAAQALQQKGVEVVKGDADDKESLKPAMQGAHTVFAVTVSVYDDKIYERELGQGKALADAAVAAGVKYFIFSSLDHMGNLSGGKIKNSKHFDVKADIEAYIRSLPMQSAFFAPGGFMQNFNSVSGPRPTDDGTYAITNIVSPTTRVPLIDTVGDTGKYVGAILASPEKYAGKVFSAATALYTYTEVCEIMSKVTGKNVVYKQLPKEVWGTFMPPGMAPSMVDMFVWVEEYGYFGPGTKEKVEWTVAQARGKLTGLEEYLRRCPLDLK